MRDLLRTIKYAAKFKGLSLLNFFLAIFGAGLDLVPPLVFKLFFDLVEQSIRSGTTTDIYNDFAKLSLIYLAFALTEIGINRASNYNWIKWFNKTEASLSADLFEHVEELSMEYFSKNQTGKIIERISKGIGDAIGVMEAVLFNFFPQIIIFTVATAVLFKTNWTFGVIVGLGIPAYVIITILFNRALIKIHDAIRDDYEKIGSVRTETIVNIKTVKSYAQEYNQLKKLSRLLQQKLEHNMNWAKVANWMYFLRGLVFYGSEFLALTLGVYFVISGKITLGSLVLIWTYVQRVYGPMNWIMRAYDNLVKQLRSIKRLFEVLDEKPTVSDATNAKDLKVKSGNVEFNNVHFNYADGDGKRIIKGLSLKITGKTTVAIVGKSGSGKTTLAKLLMRFHDVNSGKIFIDGIDISLVTQKSLRKNIGYVLQDSLLFNDTVLNNIKFGKPGATEAEVIAAAKIANADEFILKLPKKYKTIVGERGVKLSGGEQQRINIARAVLKNAPILILDEATSSLDSESELIIQDALNKLISDKTTIIIAHRLATVMRADVIVVMDKGRIVEIGNHQELIAKQGIYSKLFDIQSGAFLLDEEIIDSKLKEEVAV